MDNALPFPPLDNGPQHPSPLPAEKLLISVLELARLTSLSTRSLRRLDSSRDVPGRVMCGRAVRFQLEVIREWVRLGMPPHKSWPRAWIDTQHRRR
jgi:hypothetical protein